MQNYCQATHPNLFTLDFARKILSCPVNPVRVHVTLEWLHEIQVIEQKISYLISMCFTFTLGLILA